MFDSKGGKTVVCLTKNIPTLFQVAAWFLQAAAAAFKARSIFDKSLIEALFVVDRITFKRSRVN